MGYSKVSGCWCGKWISSVIYMFNEICCLFSSVILSVHSDDDEVRIFVDEDLLEGFKGGLMEC
jgi:hypothetical protein